MFSVNRVTGYTPELGFIARAKDAAPNGEFVLIPASNQTAGHGTLGKGAVYESMWQIFWPKRCIPRAANNNQRAVANPAASPLQEGEEAKRRRQISRLRR